MHLEAIMDGLCALWKGTLQLKWPRVSASVEEPGNTWHHRREREGRGEGLQPLHFPGTWDRDARVFIMANTLQKERKGGLRNPQ